MTIDSYSYLYNLSLPLDITLVISLEGKCDTSQLLTLVKYLMSHKKNILYISEYSVASLSWATPPPVKATFFDHPRRQSDRRRRLFTCFHVFFPMFNCFVHIRFYLLYSYSFYISIIQLYSYSLRIDICSRTNYDCIWIIIM